MRVLVTGADGFVGGWLLPALAGAGSNYLGAGEGSNGLPYVALPAAVFDAVGKFPRNLPLRPANIRALLAS